jgi:D-alanyl-D-alanine carboxypeptidase (penicillin-binding protein 5/6)
LATKIQPHSPLTTQLNFALPLPAPYPINIGHDIPPEITTASYLILDANSNVIIISKDINRKLKIASITKLMTALVALDLYKPTEILTVKNNFNNGAIIGFTKGEKISVDSLIKALLITSANDAAQTLADNSPRPFIELMNKKAQDIHLNDTLFSNPQGFDDGNNSSTVFDLARLGSYVLRYPYIREIVRTKSTVIKNTENKSYTLENVNILLSDHPEVLGMKTGFTEEAGECLLSLHKINGHEVIIVVLNSEDRFGETMQLAEWLSANFNWKNLAQHL